MKIPVSLVLLLLSFQLLAHDVEHHYDRIQLTASAQQKVKNDIIIATLYAEEEGKHAAQLADVINKKIRWALESVEQHKDIKVQTSTYTTNPVYHKSRIQRWRVRQSIQLESKNMTKMSELLGTLQARLALQNIQFAVSSELGSRIDDALITEALSGFERRAGIVVKQFKRDGYRTVNMNIATSGGARPYPLYARTAVLEQSVAAPAVEAGEQTMQVTVSGTIELQ